MTRANLVEVFSSIQGEGPSVGQTTIFVRFGGCDLRCAWCDSRHTWKPSRDWRVETEPGSAVFSQHENPASIDQVVSAVAGLHPVRHRWISLTGGEPLLQPALPEFAAALAQWGTPLHLETHGLAWQALPAVLPRIGFVSMDWKLASDVSRAKGISGASFAEEHRKFLAEAGAVAMCVKVVLTARSEDAELMEAFKSVAELAPDATLILQPVTTTADFDARPDPARVHEVARRAGDWVGDVRVIPQTHVQYDVL